MAARKEKKSLRGRKTRQQEKKRKACGKGKPGSKKRKEKLAGKENQRINKKQSLPARGRKPMRQWRRLREEEGEDTERQRCPPVQPRPVTAPASDTASHRSRTRMGVRCESDTGHAGTKLKDFLATIELSSTFQSEIAKLRHDVEEYAKQFPTIGFDKATMKHKN
ncbi:Serine hydroxymethyltransferase 1, mitochondrial [Glycine soja]|uniref:Serine hydroxymethyltransferase 1, mitochondrial n=1 Tax=Glycine soja TaxID=3848 RepID=A0A445LB47_GLYSO|nr:Serine hydroxymethyltransferase 1, mitochondrial [Glycine soja]